VVPCCASWDLGHVSAVSSARVCCCLGKSMAAVPKLALCCRRLTGLGAVLVCVRPHLMVSGGSCGSSCRSSDQVTRCCSLQRMQCRVDLHTVHQNKIWLSLESCHCHCQKLEKPLLQWHMSCLCRCSQQDSKSMQCIANAP